MTSMRDAVCAYATTSTMAWSTAYASLVVLSVYRVVRRRTPVRDAWVAVLLAVSWCVPHPVVVMLCASVPVAVFSPRGRWLAVPISLVLAAHASFFVPYMQAAMFFSEDLFPSSVAYVRSHDTPILFQGVDVRQTHFAVNTSHAQLTEITANITGITGGSDIWPVIIGACGPRAPSACDQQHGDHATHVRCFLVDRRVRAYLSDAISPGSDIYHIAATAALRLAFYSRYISHTLPEVLMEHLLGAACRVVKRRNGLMHAAREAGAANAKSNNGDSTVFSWARLAPNMGTGSLVRSAFDEFEHWVCADFTSK